MTIFSRSDGPWMKKTETVSSVSWRQLRVPGFGSLSSSLTDLRSPEDDDHHGRRGTHNFRKFKKFYGPGSSWRTQGRQQLQYFRRVGLLKTVDEGCGPSEIGGVT